MFDRYFQEITKEEAESLLEKSNEPGFIIRRSRVDGITVNKNCPTILCDADSKNVPQIPLYYAITYSSIITNEKKEKEMIIEHVRFRTFETDPIKLNAKFKELAKEIYDDIPVIQQALLQPEGEKKKENCVFIHIHRDGKLRPEEVTKVQNILAPKLGSDEKAQNGVLIISAQTPKESKNNDVAPGKTGLEFKKILTDSNINQNWIILTGHGEKAGESVLGCYALFDTADQTKIDVEMSPEEYTNLLIQGGLKSGDDINIILNICYSGAREEQKSLLTLKLETVPETSFAEKLAFSLASKGISSLIIASKTPINRFNGTYYPRLGEEKDITMLYRVEKGPANVSSPANIRLVRGEIDSNQKPRVRMQKEFIENFVISKKGIGFISQLNRDLREKFNRSKQPMRSQPGK